MPEEKIINLGLAMGLLYTFDMAKLIVGIGLPGSGKTTALEDFAKKYQYRYISTENVRNEFDIPNGVSSGPEIWNAILGRVQEELEKGLTIVVDSTFVTRHDRRSFLV